MSSNVENLQCELNFLGQSHISAFLNQNNNSDINETTLAQQLLKLNLTKIAQLYETSKFTEWTINSPPPSGDVTPIDPRLWGNAVTGDEETLKKYWDLGLKEISEHKAAVILLAGGQGTRLGFADPKGMYDVGLPSHFSLFALQALRIMKLQDLAKEAHPNITECTIFWYVMTSTATRSATEKYFSEQNYWGLDVEQVMFFDQGQLPCFDLEDKILMDSVSSIATAPDGDGGVFRALDENNVLDSMSENAIRSVHVYCVDNILVKPADPHFIGFCLHKQSDCGTKVVERLDPEDSVGMICNVAGKNTCVFEYSELTSEFAHKKDGDKLMFRAGNIENHYFTVDFLKYIVLNCQSSLPYHIVHKKIAHVNATGELLKPDTRNGIKLEQFICDVFPFAEKLVVWEVSRTCEFSPLKNSDTAGVDCPSSCRMAVDALHRQYLLAQNIFPTKKRFIEIHPSITYAGEGKLSYSSGKYKKIKSNKDKSSQMKTSNICDERKREAADSIDFISCVENKKKSLDGAGIEIIVTKPPVTEKKSEDGNQAVTTKTDNRGTESPQLLAVTTVNSRIQHDIPGEWTLVNQTASRVAYKMRLKSELIPFYSSGNATGIIEPNATLDLELSLKSDVELVDILNDHKKKRHRYSIQAIEWNSEGEFNGDEFNRQRKEMAKTGHMQCIVVNMHVENVAVPLVVEPSVELVVEPSLELVVESSLELVVESSLELIVQSVVESNENTTNQIVIADNRVQTLAFDLSTQVSLLLEDIVVLDVTSSTKAINTLSDILNQTGYVTILGSEVNSILTVAYVQLKCICAMRLGIATNEQRLIYCKAMCAILEKILEVEDVAKAAEVYRINKLSEQLTIIRKIYEQDGVKEAIQQILSLVKQNCGWKETEIEGPVVV